MSEEQPIYSINEYAPINKYIDEQARYRQTRTFWAYSKILALSLLAIGLFAILLGIAYWWFNKPHPEIVRHTVEVQPSFNSQHFNSEGGINYNGTYQYDGQYNSDVFFEIIRQKEETITQTESKTIELEGKIEQLENELSNPQINQEQKREYEESLRQYQNEIRQKEEELLIFREQLDSAQKALSEIEQEKEKRIMEQPIQETDSQGDPVALYQEYTVFEKKEVDKFLVTTGFAWDSKKRMDEGKPFNSTWCYIDRYDPIATFYFDGRNQTEQLKLFNMSLSEIKKYEKYCSEEPSLQMVY